MQWWVQFNPYLKVNLSVVRQWLVCLYLRN